MILQVLVRHYDALAVNGKISPEGWSLARVSFALVIDDNGRLTNIISLKQIPDGGKKELPVSILVPEQVKKSSGIAANFLCENSTYFLGIDEKENPERALKCFQAAGKFHHEILQQAEGKTAKAVLDFFDTWNPAEARENEILQPYLKEITVGANLIFKVTDGMFAQEDSEIQSIWEAKSAVISPNSTVMRCLVTGEKAPIARLHPSIKGINGAQPSGASLVSFNAPAFESYGHEASDKTGQGVNAPVSEKAAFKYGTALNYLIADRKHVQRIADTTILYWAENAEPMCQDIFSAECFGSNNITIADLDGIVKEIVSGGSVSCEGTTLKADNPFYILGLAPNASRLSVSFFLQNDFGTILKNLSQHHENLRIVQPSYAEQHELPLWQLLNETANQNATHKIPPAPMAAAVLRSIIQGTDYPASLFENVMLRIRTEHDIRWQKAAIIKAYFIKNNNIQNKQKIREVAQVELNEESDYLPYVLGRLFAVLEMIQKDANPGIKSTIRDKYFGSASATPASVFPLLLRLSQHHLKKIPEKGGYLDSLVSDLEGRIRQTLPGHMTLQEQGAFFLGYYHERQMLYTPRKEKNQTEEEQKDE
jgi:CRISPR-associated protein Csd1